MSGRRDPLVPEKKEALNRFKMECAKEIGHERFVRENNDHYKGYVSAAQNGHEGGPIGGQMVKKMIAQAERDLK